MDRGEVDRVGLAVRDRDDLPDLHLHWTRGSADFSRADEQFSETGGNRAGEVGFAETRSAADLSWTHSRGIRSDGPGDEAGINGSEGGRSAGSGGPSGCEYQ